MAKYNQGFIWGGGGGGGGGETRVCPPPKKTCFPAKIIWQNNGNYTGIALLINNTPGTYCVWVLKAEAGL